MRHTPAAVMDAGACSCAAMGSASATVTLRGTKARASSAPAMHSQMWDRAAFTQYGEGSNGQTEAANSPVRTQKSQRLQSDTAGVP